MAASQDLLTRALELEPQERARLASRLLASLHPERDDEAQAAWNDELVKRAQEARSDEWQGDEWSVVRERVKPR